MMGRESTLGILLEDWKYWCLWKSRGRLSLLSWRLLSPNTRNAGKEFASSHWHVSAALAYAEQLLMPNAVLNAC